MDGSVFFFNRASRGTSLTTPFSIMRSFQQRWYKKNTLFKTLHDCHKNPWTGYWSTGILWAVRAKKKRGSLDRHKYFCPSEEKISCSWQITNLTISVVPIATPRHKYIYLYCRCKISTWFGFCAHSMLQRFFGFTWILGTWQVLAPQAVPCSGLKILDGKDIPFNVALLYTPHAPLPALKTKTWSVGLFSLLPVIHKVYSWGFVLQWL